MLRLIRRYNKWILAVGGTLLLITFLIPEAIQRLSQRSAVMGGTWARTNDGEVTGADEIRLRDEMRVIGFLGDSTLGLPGFSRDPVHWYLLQHEAVRAGLVGGRSDGMRSLRELEMADPEAPSADEMLWRLASEAQVSREFVLETLAKLNGVNRLMALHERSARLSDRRVRAAARDMLTSVDADLVVIDARTLAAELDEAPSEADLEAHLVAYGSLAPGSGDHGFGYRLPDRVRVEWLTVPSGTIRRSVETSDRLSNIELRKHRDRNLALFPRAGGPDEDDFETVRSQVRTHLLGLLADEQTETIAKFISDQLSLPQRGVPRQGPYLILPDDWSSRQARLDAVAESAASRFRIDLPIYRTSGPTMIEPVQLDTLPDLGNATTDRVGAAPMRPSQLVAQARELGGSDLYAVQRGVALPMFRTPAGDLVVVRIIDTDRSRAPHSVDEVRDKLVTDLRTLRQFESLVARLDSIRADALRDGLVPMARSFGTTVRPAPRLRGAEPQFLEFGFRMVPALPGLGQSESAIRRIVEAAVTLPLDTPASELPEDLRTIAFPVERQLAVVVARITGVTPLTSEEFTPLRERGTVERTVLGEQIAPLRERLFSREALIERNGFRLMREVEEEDDDFEWEDWQEEWGADRESATALR